MTIFEYKSALEALHEDAFASFRNAFGGDFKTRQQYVDDFVHHPEHERQICQLFALQTQGEKLVEASLASMTCPGCRFGGTGRASLDWEDLPWILLLRLPRRCHRCRLRFRDWFWKV